MNGELKLIRRYGWFLWLNAILTAPFVGFATAIDRRKTVRVEDWAQLLDTDDPES